MMYSACLEIQVDGEFHVALEMSLQWEAHSKSVLVLTIP